MYLRLEQIERSIHDLMPVHPFFTLTFLVCKENKLPIGKAEEFRINALEKDFLERHYKLISESDHYYKLSRVNNKKAWIRSEHASKGSQKTRTTTFKDAFIHPVPSKWGWQNKYVEFLKSKLHKGKQIPAFSLAVWLYREEAFPDTTTPEDILQKFLNQFCITSEEKHELFYISLPVIEEPEEWLGPDKISWPQLKEFIGESPPDAPPEEGGTLAYLAISGVGPADSLSFEPAERVSLITGDNGLGKTFILDCAWWALSGQWAGPQAYPLGDAVAGQPQISFRIATEQGSTEKTLSYDWSLQGWPSLTDRPTLSGLLIYARVDGSFAVWDPAKHYWGINHSQSSSSPGSLVFSREEVWNGLKVRIGERTEFLSNGLISDWVNWQNNPARYPFETLQRVLRRLSPPDLEVGDLGVLSPGSPVRIPRDSREIPTIRHPYGEVPILYASAGVRRIVAMAYLIVWVWEEHKAQSKLIRKDPQRRMVILVDEMEAHLHPQWQRIILPALLDVKDDLDSELKVQSLIATHSPLIMASVEPRFDPKTDKLFHLNLSRHAASQRGEVVLEQLPFVRQGPVDSWLMSEVFELGEPRSLPAEKAIKRAEALQVQECPALDEIRAVNEELKKNLSAHDDFWPWWKYFAEKHGVPV